MTVSTALADLAAPHSTAVLTMEMQRGVIGDLSTLRELADEAAARHIVAHTARLLDGARNAGVRVVHCTAESRPDRAGSALNAPLLSRMETRSQHLHIGSPQAQVLAELGPEDVDLISARSHGLSPFGGTSLDVTLRNLGVSTVVAAGVSVNVGLLGLAIEAVNLGYRVIVATDAVCGFPRAYADDVMRYSMALVAFTASVDELLATWAMS